MKKAYQGMGWRVEIIQDDCLSISIYTDKIEPQISLRGGDALDFSEWFVDILSENNNHIPTPLPRVEFPPHLPIEGISHSEEESSKFEPSPPISDEQWERLIREGMIVEEGIENNEEEEVHGAD